MTDRLVLMQPAGLDTIQQLMEKLAESQKQLATFKNAYAEQVELHNLTLDELAECQAERRSKDNCVICPACNNEFVAVPVDVQEERASLRQQLAESQAREKVLRDLLEYSSYELRQYTEGFTVHWEAVDAALALPFDSTALDEAIKQAKREALLEVANEYPYITDDELRSMADELKS